MERHLIVGLGNPGPRYAGNRHNVGFMITDRVAALAGFSLSRAKFKGRYGTGSLAGCEIVVLQPDTFMNLSGESVQPACKFFDVPPERLIVVHDELDLGFGVLRLKAGGGHAGHNGLRSIIDRLGSREYLRLRVGVGRPVHGDAADYVLADFSSEERPWLSDLTDRGANALHGLLRDGLSKAMNALHAPA